MNYSAGTYIIICVFFIYLFDVFKVQSFRLNNIDLKKSVAIKIFSVNKRSRCGSIYCNFLGTDLVGDKSIRSNLFIGSIR